MQDAKVFLIFRSSWKNACSRFEIPEPIRSLHPWRIRHASALIGSWADWLEQWWGGVTPA
eukprot:scaffold871_cov130-Cylindrotheca_fusiformis.AAC.2